MAEAAEPAKRNTISYDYNDVPTIRRFALSRARHRILVGPFGSGKSVGCVMEMLRKAHEQAPGPDGLRRSRWAVVRNCYDDQTEILTEKRGWQLFKDLRDNDKVATLDGDNLVYRQPEGVAVHPYKGDMIGFEGEGANFLVTPDHKMYVSKRRTRKKIWGDFEEATAQEIYGSHTVRVRRDAEWVGRPTDLSSTAYEWLGLWFAEGSYGVYQGKERVALTQCLPDGVEYARALAEDVGLDCAEWKRNKGINFVLRGEGPLAERIAGLVKNAGKAPCKTIPQEIMEAPREHLRAFLKGVIAGDGSTCGGTTRITTSSKVMADQLQEIALKAGYVANVGLKGDDTGRRIVIDGVDRGKTNGPSYHVTILREKKYRPILNVYQKHTNKLRGWYKQPYSGMVYCVEMPLVPVYVRRKGKAFWCFRTYGQLKDTTMKTVFDWLPYPQFGNYRVADHIYEIIGFPGVRLELFFRALDRPDQVANLLSLEITGAWINEAREVPREIWEALDGRIGRYPSKRHGGATWYGTIADTNPPDEDNWLYKLIEVEKPKNVEKFKQPGGRSPYAENIRNLPPRYYTDLAEGKTEEYIRSYIDGEYGFVSEGTPVYKSSYNDSLHCAKSVIEPIKSLNLVTGWDFYLMPSLIIMQVTNRGKLRVLDELIGQGMGAERFVHQLVMPLLNQKYRGMGVFGYGDPTGNARSQTDEMTCYDVLRSNNFHWVKPARTNSVMARIGAVENYLVRLVDGEPAFELSPNCVMLRKGFNGGYRYKNDVPEKNIYSHPHDALQYGCLFMADKVRITSRTNAQRAAAKRYNPASFAGY